MRFRLFFSISATLAIFPLPALAHCPLCTAGAGALAILAASFGVSTASIGIFIGAFSIAIGLWFSKYIKKQFFSKQEWAIALVSYLLTIWPLTPLLTNKYGSIYLSWAGDYGTLLNRVYVINWFIAGSLIGAVIMIAAPWISKQITMFRSGQTIPYQGIALTFAFLIFSGLLLQLLVG